MQNNNENNRPSEYQIKGTQYTVNSVFREAPGAEHIADKITRLILHDSQQKTPSL
ncbi:MAG: transposon-encoded TnpW family protein [Oscillospiraceae bacterium]|nr:transposon-encoded TnpW family protein [Oscillospiraceae bacterium]